MITNTDKINTAVKNTYPKGGYSCSHDKKEPYLSAIQRVKLDVHFPISG